MRTAHRAPLDHGRIAVLGLVTISAYGAWYYAFGVLLDPIVEDTGWSYTTLSASFAAGQALVGAGSIAGGMLLDRRGGRTVFVTAAVVSGPGLLLASVASQPLVFAVAAAIGMGALGGLAFYHVTMAVVVRVNPTEPGRAIAALTLWGAFSSAIYLPATAWLIEQLGWRSTVRCLALSAVGALALAALVVPAPPTATEEKTDSWRVVAGAIFRSRERRALTVAAALTGVAVSILLVYQVPVMVAAGLPLTTAATVAGLRGVAQLGGRLPLGWLLARAPTRRLLVVALGAIATGALLLAAASTVTVAVAFAVVAGFGIGAWSPLQGVYAESMFERRTLGTTLGLYAAIGMTFGALGPLIAGPITDATTDPRLAALTAALAAALGALFLAHTPTDRHTAPPGGRR
jgi:MFS family permease